MKIKFIKSIAARKLFRKRKFYITLSGGTALLLVLSAGTKYLSKTFCEIFSADIFNFTSPAATLNPQNLHASEIIKKISACLLTDSLCLLVMIPAVFVLFSLAVIFISDESKSDIYRSHISIRRIYSCAWAVIWRCAAGISFAAAVYLICSKLCDYALSALGHIIPETAIILLCGFPVCLSVLMCAKEMSSFFPLAYISIVFYDVAVKKALEISRESSKKHQTEILLFNLSFALMFFLSYISFGILFILYAFPLRLVSSALYSSHIVTIYLNKINSAQPINQ